MSRISILEELRSSMEGRSVWGRGLLLLWSVWIGYHLVLRRDISIVQNPFYFFDHGIHEIGHWITRPLGMWVSVASGSIFQFLFPLVPMYALFKERDYHAVFFLCTWQASNIYHISEYARSAEFSALELITPHYITLYHDWVWMLGRLDAIDSAATIGGLFRALAWIFLIVSVLGQILCLALKPKSE